MESSQNISYNGGLVDQAFAILCRNNGHYTLDQAPIIQGAVETIFNHMEGADRLTKVEYVVLREYIARLHKDEQYLFASALANIIVISRPMGQMSEADSEFLHFTTILADAEVVKEMTK
ncbi:hypothetical protein FPOAC2_06282 [Fusarium poae]|jgi:hypothetical protein